MIKNKNIWLGFALMIGISSACYAHQYSIGVLSIIKPHLRETPKNATVAGGYLSIKNNGDSPEVLLNATSSISETVEIHEMTLEKEIMKMRQVPEGLVIGVNQILELKAGGFHLMFFGLNKEIKQGDTHKIILNFKNAGEVTVPFKVWEPLHASHHNKNMDHHH